MSGHRVIDAEARRTFRTTRKASVNTINMPSFAGKHCCSEVRRLGAALKIEVIPGVSAIEGLQVAQDIRPHLQSGLESL